MSIDLAPNVSLHSSVEHHIGIAEVTGSNPVEALIFFRLLLCNCLNWKMYCAHSSLVKNIVCWYIVKQWIALKVRSDWLVELWITFAIYLRATRGKKWHLGLHPWQLKKSSKLIFSGVYYLLACVTAASPLIFLRGEAAVTQTNYLSVLVCQWPAVDVYFSALQLSKYPLLATSTPVNSC